MDVTNATAATSTSTASKPAETASERSAAALSSDFETFLKMLTVQMENQDPLKPIESSDFAVQLATFSGVEQQVRSNDLLEKLVGQQSVSALSQLAGWVGMEARAAVPAVYDGTNPVTYYPDPPAGADQATLIVRNEQGAPISRVAIPVTSAPQVWNGTDQQGARLAAGNYEFQIEYRSGGDFLDNVTAEVYAPVTEARLVGGSPMVIFGTGGQVSSDDVKAVRAPQQP